MNLKKVVPPAPPPLPEWEPHPTLPGMEVSRITRFWRTKQPIPVEEPVKVIDPKPYDGS